MSTFNIDPMSYLVAGSYERFLFGYSLKSTRGDAEQVILADLLVPPDKWMPLIFRIIIDVHLLLKFRSAFSRRASLTLLIR